MANSYSYYRALSLVEQSIAASVPVFDDNPIVFSKNHEQFMKQLFRKMKGGKYHSSSGTVLKVLLIAAVLLSIATVVIGIPRTKAYNVTDYGVYSEYAIVGEVTETPVDSLEIGYLPEGFEKVNEAVNEYLIVYNYKYNDETINISKSDLRLPVSFDSENCIVEKINADGLEYICYYNDDYNGCIYNDGKYIYFISTTVDKNETFKIVRYLK